MAILFVPLGIIAGLFLLLCALQVHQQVTQRQGHRESQREDWQALMQGLGLRVLEKSEYQITAQGQLDNTQVQTQLRLEHTGFGSSKQQILYSTIQGGGPNLPQSLELRGDSHWAHPLVEESDRALGDPRFDGKLELSSLDARACAALSHAAREVLAPMLEQGARVQGGRVVWETDFDRAVSDRARHVGWVRFSDAMEQERQRVLLEQRVRATAEAARLLSVAPEELHQRLAQNALHDPARKLRLRNLRFLVASETQTPPALLVSTARSLLADEYVPLRLVAAAQLGAEGHGVLRALAADSRIPLAERVQAVQALGRGSTPDLAGLKALLGSPRPSEVHCAALAAIPASGAALTDVVLRCAQSKDERVRAAAAQALGVLAQAHTESSLLQLLSDDSSEVQQASAQALGSFASVAAVEHLLPLTQALLDSQLRQAARGAVGSIQSRLGDVEAGRVSLAEGRELEGALALADDAAVRIGELSLSAPPASSQGPLDVPARAALKS